MSSSYIDLIFPRFCLGCGYVGRYICPDCEGGMRRGLKNTCIYCGKPAAFGLTHPRCRRMDGVDGFTSYYIYDGFFKKILRETKYKGATQVLEELLSYPKPELFATLMKWGSLYNLVIIPIPLHPKRMQERGFNQAAIIAHSLLLPQTNINQNILFRKINTAHLANIKNKLLRKKNIKNAFSCVHPCPEAALLVDDVATTGATIMECVRTLKKNGVKHVLAISLAKG